jgi:hypothetical protein
MPALGRDRKGLVLILCDLATSHCHLTFAVILPQQHHAAWLGKTEDGNLKALLIPYPADQMQMWEISTQVNSPMTIHYFGQVSPNCLFVFFREARSEINCFLESRRNRRLSKNSDNPCPFTERPRE